MEISRKRVFPQAPGPEIGNALRTFSGPGCATIARYRIRASVARDAKTWPRCSLVSS